MQSCKNAVSRFNLYISKGIFLEIMQPLIAFLIETSDVERTIDALKDINKVYDNLLPMYLKTKTRFTLDLLLS